MSDTTAPAMTTPPASRDLLLTPDFLRKLEQFSLALSRTFASHLHGERRSTRRGASVEFADFRNYVHGDDLRYVDWNVYARLEKLFLKLYLEEEDLHLHLLLDTSRSMDFGTPRKSLAAARLCAALGYIALARYDRVSVNALGAGLGARLTDLRGRQQAFALFGWLQQRDMTGETDFARACRDFALRVRKPGMVVLVTDGFGPGLDEGLRTLAGRKFAVTLVQVLAPEELRPPLTGDLRLVDAETGEAREVTISAGLLAHYQQRLDAHFADLTRLGNRYGIPILRLSTDEPFEDFVLKYLKLRGIVR